MEDKRRISFGERVGAVKPPTIMEVETMSEVLSVALWNVIVNSFITDIPESEGYNSWYNTKCASKEIWEYLDLNILEMPDIERNGFIADTTNFIQVLHEKFWNSTESQWHKKFDLVQFLLEIENKYGIQEFSKRINKKLIDHNSGYRVIKNLIVPITNNEELKEIQEATKDKEPHAFHLSKAIELLSKKPNPDYRNSAKEAIAAVESLATSITKTNTLPKALPVLEQEYELPRIMKVTIDSFYGISSDRSGGIRHFIDGNTGKFEFKEAKFTLIFCSSIINYLKELR